MKQKIIAYFILAIIVSICFAIEGPVSGTWDSDQSITGNVEVLDGELLTINPGVTITFEGQFRFDINGTLSAVGNEANPILFTATDTNTGWLGLIIIDGNNSSEISVLNYCNFEYAKAMGVTEEVKSGGALFIENTDVMLSHIEISNCTADWYGGGIYIKDSYLDNEYQTDDDLYLKHISISDCSSRFDGGGAFFYNSKPYVYRWVLGFNSTQWNGGAVACFNGSDVYFQNCTISENSANYNGSGMAAMYNSDLELKNCIVYDNSPQELYMTNGGDIYATYTCIKNGNSQYSYYGTGCRNFDPLFINNDFEINGDSPCIDAGDPNPQYNDEDGTRNDMGAFPVSQSGIRGTVSFKNGVDFGDHTLNEAVISVYFGVNDSLIATTNPDSSGVYHVLLTPGTYKVEADLEGFQVDPINYPAVVVNENQLSTNIDFEFDVVAKGKIICEYITLQGKPMDDPAIEGIQIKVLNTDYITYPIPVPLGDDPIHHYRFVIEIEPGFHSIQCSYTGYQTVTVHDIAVQPAIETYIDNIDMIPLTYDSWIEGRISLKESLPADDVTNVVFQTEGLLTTQVNADGTYRLKVLNGTHSVTAMYIDPADPQNTLYPPITLHGIITIPNQTQP